MTSFVLLIFWWLTCYSLLNFNLGCFCDDCIMWNPCCLCIVKKSLWCCREIRLRTPGIQMIFASMSGVSHLVPYTLNQWNHMSFHLLPLGSINWIDTLATNDVNSSCQIFCKSWFTAWWTWNKMFSSGGVIVFAYLKNFPFDTSDGNCQWTACF